MKKFLALFFAVITLFSVVGCSSNKEQLAINAEQAETIQKLEQELQTLEAENAEMTALLSQPEEPAPEYVYAVNATINGETKAEITDAAEFTAEAILKDGMVVDHWTLNGEAQADTKANTFTFKAAPSTIAEPVFRPEKKVTTINAEMYFLDEDGDADGDAFTEFVFEEDYVNPLTEETVPGGTVDVMLKAVVPKEHSVDYWLINGVTYDHALDSIVVKNLDEATTYEVVLKKDKYYTVTCTNCSYKNKKSAKVKAGTKITVDGSTSSIGWYEVNGSHYSDTTNYKMSITVNKDLRIEYHPQIN